MCCPHSGHIIAVTTHSLPTTKLELITALLFHLFLLATGFIHLQPTHHYLHLLWTVLFFLLLQTIKISLPLTTNFNFIHLLLQSRHLEYLSPTPHPFRLSIVSHQLPIFIRQRYGYFWFRYVYYMSTYQCGLTTIHSNFRPTSFGDDWSRPQV